jgi:GT2 family glycosyltransferase
MKNPAPPLSVDIAIVNYFGAADVARCLERLVAWPHGIVWLVDNSADAGELAELARLAEGRPWVRLVDAGANLGFGRGCNLAFEKSEAPFFLLLNPDAQASAADLLALAQAMREQPHFGAVSPRIFWNPSRTFVLPAAFAQTPCSALAQSLASRSHALALWLARRSLRTQRQQMVARDPFEVGFLAGAVMMLRREAVLAAGGLFDPDYFMFYEDSDLSLRLRRSGWRLAMVPRASAVHEYRHKSFKAALMTRSREQYYRKRYPWFHRLSGAVTRVDALARPVPVERWYDVLARPCHTAEDFNAQTGQAGVVAFSPSMLMMPAIFRPQGEAARPFSSDEWELLEPADYVALLEDRSGTGRWVFFRRG